MSSSFDARSKPIVHDWAIAIEQIADELPDLLPEAEAQAVQARLGPLLSRIRDSCSEGEQVIDQIAELLTPHDSVRRRLNQLLGPGPVRGHPKYAGDPIVTHDQYRCPDCGRAWVVLDADEDEPPPERCPDHGCMLTFVPGM